MVSDVVLILLIFQNYMRPLNSKENKFYLILIKILIFLGGLQLLLIFGSTMFTTAGSICAGAYLKSSVNAPAQYRIQESQFVIWVTICQVAIFMTLICAITAYNQMENRIASLVKILGGEDEEEFESSFSISKS